MMPSKDEWIKALNDRHGEDLQNKISSTTVGICGLGGLGSNIAIALARAGVGKLILFDFDNSNVGMPYATFAIDIGDVEVTKSVTSFFVFWR